MRSPLKRFVHRYAIGAPVGVAVLYAGVLAAAEGAASFDIRAKVFVSDQITMWFAFKDSSTMIGWAIFVFLVWLALILWSWEWHKEYDPIESKLNAVEGRQGATGIVNATLEADSLSASGMTGLHGLYVGNIIAAADKLASHHRLELAITGFNGTGESISIVKIEGHVSAALSGSQDRLEMPVPALQKLVALQPFDEFTLIIHQEFDPKLTTRFLAALARDHITLYLGELVIGLATQTNPAKRGSLPLWDGVILKRRDDLVSTRVQIRAAIARATGKGTAKGISE